MKQTQYTDEKGRCHAVMLPDGVPDEDAAKGLPLGPPSLESLGLPEELEIRLHNQLFSRHLFTAKDVRARRIDVLGSLMGAFKLDAEKIVQVYLSQEVKKNGRRSGLRQQVSTEPKRAKRRARR